MTLVTALIFDNKQVWKGWEEWEVVVESVDLERLGLVIARRKCRGGGDFA